MYTHAFGRALGGGHRGGRAKGWIIAYSVCRMLCIAWQTDAVARDAAADAIKALENTAKRWSLRENSFERMKVSEMRVPVAIQSHLQGHMHTSPLLLHSLPMC